MKRECPTLVIQILKVKSENFFFFKKKEENDQADNKEGKRRRTWSSRRVALATSIE